MVADTPAGLHAMADRIGVQREWFQSFAKAKRPRYDISEPKRRLAVQNDAIEVDSVRLVEICRRILADDTAWLTDPESLAQKA